MYFEMFFPRGVLNKLHCFLHFDTFSFIFGRRMLQNIIQNDAHSLTSNKSPALSKLRCPHDFSHHDDFRDNLATLLEGSDVIDVSGEDEEAAISLLDDEKVDEKGFMVGTGFKFFFFFLLL